VRPLAPEADGFLPILEPVELCIPSLGGFDVYFGSGPFELDLFIALF